MKNESSVYVVVLGENYEGARKISLHRTLAGACKMAQAWIEDSVFDWEEMSPSMKSPVLRCWEGGCDWIQITGEEIKD